MVRIFVDTNVRTVIHASPRYLQKALCGRFGSADRRSPGRVGPGLPNPAARAGWIDGQMAFRELARLLANQVLGIVLRSLGGTCATTTPPV